MYTVEQLRVGRKIVSETVERYRDGAARCRHQETGECLYADSSGRGCAVGHYMIPEIKDYFRELNACAADDGGRCWNWSIGTPASALAREWTENLALPQLRVDCLDDMLVPEVRGMPVEFWSRLQVLHDTNEFWESCGSNRGSELRRLMFLESSDILRPLTPTEWFKDNREDIDREMAKVR